MTPNTSPAAVLSYRHNVQAAQAMLGVITAAVMGDTDHVETIMGDVVDEFAAAGGLGLAWLLTHLLARATGQPVDRVVEAVGHQLALVEARLDVGGTVGSGG